MKLSSKGSCLLVAVLLGFISFSSIANENIVAKAQKEAAQCPFSLGNLCFYPAVGAMYGAKSAGEKYKDLRFAAVIHEQLNSTNKHSFGAMIAPGENFIDAAGFGGAYSFIKTGTGTGTGTETNTDQYLVLNYGVMAKRHKIADQDDDIRGGVYLMLSYSF